MESTSRALIVTRSRSPNPTPNVPPRPRSPTFVVSPALVQEWQPILHTSNQVVLYNPHSHALSIAKAPEDMNPSAVFASRQRRVAITAGVVQPCPYCKQALPRDFHDFHPRLDDPEVDDDARWVDLDQNVAVDESESGVEAHGTDPAYHSRASDYFRLLGIANDVSSRITASSPASSSSSRAEDHSRSRSRGRSQIRSQTPERYQSEKNAFPTDKMAEGYFKSFFQEEYKLGMGANGSVFLCKHVLDGNALGHFAVKKIAVGESHSYLLKTLREVRLLERLRHPNIITYHHAWLESCQFSSFGPKVPTLHVLMQWAEGGSLDDFIDARLGRKPAHVHMHPFLSAVSPLSASEPASPASSTSGLPSTRESSVEPEEPTTPTQTAASPAAFESEGKGKEEDVHSKSARIRAFRAVQRAPPEDKERIRREMGGLLDDIGANSATAVPVAGPSTGASKRSNPTEWMPVHLLSAEEVKSLFQDVVEGLAFLHSKSILHLDLKPGNVLLTWDEGRLIPRAMLSDFGTSRDMINTSTQRSGNTGTLEYTAPESLPSPQTGLLRQIDSKADMWSLGMILHKMLFFRLPYRYAADGDANGEPISREEEGEKMDRLEKEVLTYPGFKSTSGYVSGFEARRLPRAFLVLLETLLSTLPSKRPSCERVAHAIREGKLDPLPDVPIAELPLSRPQRATNGSHSEQHTPSSSPPNVSPQMPINEKMHMLALPSPDPERPHKPSNSSGRLRSWLDGDHLSLRDRSRRTQRWKVITMRFVRSSLLVAKVLTIPRMCGTHPRPVIAALLLALAILDTVWDHHDWEDTLNGDERTLNRQIVNAQFRRSGALITLGLALLHFGFVAIDVIASREGSVFGELWNNACCIPLVDT